MRLLPVLTALLVILSVIPVEARRRVPSGSSSAPAASSEQEVLRDFEQILDLWREGRYNELFDRTAVGRQGREQFAKKLATAPRRPACCWEKMQDARVSLSGERVAVVKARLGFEGAVPDTEFVTKGIKLEKEEGVWLISQSDLFSLAEVSKKRARYKYLPIQKKK